MPAVETTRKRRRLGPWRIGLLTVAALLLLALGALAIKVTTPPAPFPIPPDLALAYDQARFDSDDNALPLYESLGVLMQNTQVAVSSGRPPTRDSWQYKLPSQWNDDDVADARVGIASAGGGLKAFREAAEKPYFVAPESATEPMPSFLSAVRVLAHTAVCQAGLSLRDGDEQAAVDAFIPPLRVAAHLTQSGPLMLRMIAGTVEFIALRGIWDAVSSGQFHNAKSLERLAEGIEFLESQRGTLADSLRAEYRQAHDDLERWARNGPQGVREAMEPLISQQGQDEASLRFQTLQYWAELQVFYPRALERVTAVYQKQVRVLKADPLQALRNEMAARHSPRHRDDVLSDSVLSRWKAVEREAWGDAQRRAIAIGIAAARYRLEHDDYPPDLAALAPKYLKAMPLDPYDGQPMKVRREPDAFVIWSIGEDFTDQGGHIALQPRDYISGKKGDQVWRLEAPPVKKGKR